MNEKLNKLEEIKEHLDDIDRLLSKIDDLEEGVEYLSSRPTLLI